LPVDGPKDYEIGYGKPPVAARFKKGNRANPHGRPRRPTSLAAVLQWALDAPAAPADGKRRRLSKRDQMIRNLVERSAEGELAATKLLFEILRRADPQSLGPNPGEAAALGEDALAQLKERLARLARAQTSAAADVDQGGTPLASDDPREPKS
jgi:hypothetical protein